MEAVRVEVEDHVATVVMHDPARRNALGPAMLDGLCAAFDGLRGRDVRAVVLRAGADDKVWCSGFDVNELAPGTDPLRHDGPLQALFRRVRDCPAPVIAMLHGSAWGGGADLALRCDILVAGPGCTLAFTPARLGLPYDSDGLLNVLLRAGPNVALEMFATAAPVPAERAHALGLLNHLVPDAGLEGFTREMARRIASNAPLSVASAKRQIRALAAAVSLAPDVAQALHAGRLRALESADYREGLAAFHARRAAGFEGR